MDPGGMAMVRSSSVTTLSLVPRRSASTGAFGVSSYAARNMGSCAISIACAGKA